VILKATLSLKGHKSDKRVTSRITLIWSRDVIEPSRVEFDNFGTGSFKRPTKRAMLELELEPGFGILV
jgi:hypothetical protein